MDKDFLNKSIVILKNIFCEILNRVSVFYNKLILPNANKLICIIKEFFKLSCIDFKKDNKEFLRIIYKSIKCIESYIKKAGNKIQVRYYEWKNKRIIGKISTSPVKKQRRFSIPNYWYNLIFKIKYLSYKKLIIYSLAFIVLDVFLLWFSTYRILYAKHYWEGSQDKKIFVRPGKSLDEVIDDLKQNDILKSRFIFKVYVKLSGKEDRIISKRYLFENGISNSELLNLLTDRNMVQMEKFTLIEGLRIKQIAKILETKLQLSGEKFIKETENDSLINILGLKDKVENLEGFLFPDTYYLPLNVDEKELVGILFNEFRKKVLNDNDIVNEVKAKNKVLLEVIILSSIIQGETNLKEEMGTISGVYYNRLKKRMKLEADPTVQYALPDGPKPRLKFSDLKIDSPYNTYKHFGLPPGPINNPGLYAIKAALNPDNNNFLFFVATGNGKHKFSETYGEHLKAVEEYKKNMEKKIEQ
jgi:UPF0755 protein